MFFFQVSENGGACNLIFLPVKMLLVIFQYSFIMFGTVKKLLFHHFIRLEFKCKNRSKVCFDFWCPEAVFRKFSVKKLSWKILRNSQEDTSARVFFNEVAGVSLQLYKKESGAVSYFTENLRLLLLFVLNIRNKQTLLNKLKTIVSSWILRQILKKNITVIILMFWFFEVKSWTEVLHWWLKYLKRKFPHHDKIFGLY